MDNIRPLETYLPTTLSLIHVGATAYIALVDPHTRNSHKATSARLCHWNGVYLTAKNMMSCVSASAVLAALNCYRIHR